MRSVGEAPRRHARGGEAARAGSLQLPAIRWTISAALLAGPDALRAGPGEGRLRDEVQRERKAERGADGALLYRSQDPTRLIIDAPMIPNMMFGIQAARYGLIASFRPSAAAAESMR